MGIKIKHELGLSITSVENEKDNEEKVEKIFVKASRNVNLGDYLIYDATFDDDEGLSNRGRHVYRFPKCELAEGQRAVLRIEEGVRSPIPVTFGGKPGFRFYWGRKGPVINNGGDKLTLVEIKGSSVHTA
ncbi:hypothetical protein [Hymenobacter actinosclerus]|uniref:Lamin Tail Domain n=1 Tax=Hymenobacter actinosclerus TaxID=82805 RepID=A0A1I0IDL3_9BACT|nr:hypothetical protein [Hymenobacter actinosclerus]SET94814.1 hypothetical protein SAMN04487998_3306 [Hymenobacter actinosclerus]